jgi:putative tryptophan/tyrosine transport system substrate-binding protein
MRRRDFISLVGGSAVAWPRAARAQQPAMPVVGYIGAVASSPFNPAFNKGLSEAGYTNGRNVVVEYRWIEAHFERLPAIVSDLIQRRVDVIAAVGDAAALAAKAATRSIPIVFRIGGDPVASGLVRSLNRPGENLTGDTTMGRSLGQKQLQMLRELLHADAVVAVLTNPANANAAREIEDLQAAARLLSIHLLIFDIGGSNDLEAAFARFADQTIDGILPVAEALFFQQREQLVALVARKGIPAIYTDRVFVEAGGLMSYGTDISEGFRLAGVYTGRILKGEKAGDLPVQQATKVELIINLKTARTLGITMSPDLLSIADQVIE